MKKLIIIILIFILPNTTISFADNVISMHYLFSGKNIYAPSIINDGVYKLWYGGWNSDSDYPNDKIYYRSSSDNVSYNNSQTVIIPTHINSNVVHVNDPSVTKHFNTTSNKWQYTMFFTVCFSPCNQSDNTIYSSVSDDGLTWYDYKLLTPLNYGAAEPSAILYNDNNGSFWYIYYVERLNPQIVKMSKVNINREIISTHDVYNFTTNNISGVEIRYFNGSWHLFFNVFYSTKVDIWEAESYNPMNFGTNTGNILISNNGLTYCATMTPAILNNTDGGQHLNNGIENQYDLYFGLTYRETDGSCNLTKQKELHRWRWTD